MRLGQTRDATEIIPGDPNAIEANANALKGLAEELERAGDRLRGIDVKGWSGKAAGEFQERFSRESTKWFKCADSATEAASALNAYSSALRWAQSRAIEAIHLWDEKEGSGDSTAPRSRRDNGDDHSDSGSGTEAEAIIHRAAEKLAEEGDRTAKILGDQDGDGALALMLNAVTQGWTADGKFQAKGPDATAAASASWKDKLAEAKASAQLGSISGGGSVQNPWFKGDGKFQGDVGADANASASVGKDSLKANAGARVGADASVESKVSSGPAEASGKATGTAGAEAEAKADIGYKNASAEVGGFAGAKGGVEGSADVGGIGVTGSAEGWVGAGAKGGIDIGMNDEGNLEIKGKVGLSYPAGGSVGGGMEINPDKVADTVGDAADAVGDAWNDAGESVQQTMSGWL